MLIKSLFFVFLTLVLSGNLSANERNKKILMIFPQFENLTVTEKRVKAGIELAFKTYNNNQQVGLLSVDVRQGIDQLSKDVSRAIDRHSPVAIIGGISSNVASVIAEIAERRKIPFLTPFATNPNITLGRKYTFRACFDDRYQARVLATEIAKMTDNGSGVILTNNRSIYSLGFAKEFEIEYRKKTGKKLKVVLISGVSSVTSEVIASIGAAKPNFILIPSYQVEAASIIAKIAPMIKSTMYFGPDSWGGGRLFHKLLKESGTKFQGYYVQHWSDEAENTENKKFLELLKGVALPNDVMADGTAMNAPIAIGYDSGLIVAKAISKLNSVTASSLYRELSKLKVSGTSGEYNFNKGVRTPAKGLYIYSINHESEKLYKQVGI